MHMYANQSKELQEEEKDESDEEDEITRQQKRMQVQYQEIDKNELKDDKLFASPSEKCTLFPLLKHAFHDGSLARLFASSSHAVELVQDAITHSILLSKNHKARTMQVWSQDASGNSHTELQQLVKTVYVTKYHRYTLGDDDEECLDAILTIGTDPDHSIRFQILQGATPAEYQSMMTRWGLTSTSVYELQGFFQQLGQQLELRFD